MMENKVQRHRREAMGQIQKVIWSFKQVNVMKTKGKGGSGDSNVQAHERLN